MYLHTHLIARRREVVRQLSLWQFDLVFIGERQGLLTYDIAVHIVSDSIYVTLLFFYLFEYVFEVEYSHLSHVIRRYLTPKHFKDTVYLSQLTQALCIKNATEGWRINPRCHG